ncbi:WxL protein peptidoglycan domain-containing protein [Streptomyces sp. NPDC016562]|uniref:WxL protein peptidoglycan domain-containing protein n=1 Tax=Streptomyces sp. NPDC016562 TaxID=3364966 RepID=UPI0036F7445C
MRIRTPSYGPHVSRLLALLALAPLLALVTGTGLLSATAARAADNGTWSVFPTPAAGAATTDRAYFFHQGEAGTTLGDSVTILNSSEKELTFQVFATDAVNTPSGGAFALLPVESPPKDVGAWITLAPQAARPVTVPPKGRTDIPFTVKVPADATPGDHVGGIVALGTAVEGVQQEGKVQVGVKRSVGARLYFRVPGPVTPGLSVEDVRVTRAAPLLPWVKNARATVSYTLVNRGNLVVEPTVAVSARGLFGRELLNRPTRELKLSLLPGQRIELTEPWPDAPQSDRVSVTVTAGATAHPDLRSQSGTRFTAVPWLAVGALLLAAGAALALRVLRRRRSRVEEHPEPAPHLTPAP